MGARLCLSLILLCFALLEIAVSEDYQPRIAAASDEAQRALEGFRLPDGMRGSVWAAEPMLANPVAFCIDEQGRIYVCETFRQERGVQDNRSHMSWLLDDLAAQSLDDRLAYFKKHLGDKLANFAKEHDRIRLLEDRNQDGSADHAIVFADGFSGPLEGTGAGVLARRGDVFYTCIPHLWRLRDKNGDGQADERDSLSYGYGVRVAFRGHDSHGLVMGPDGRLYFSIGDRGYNIKTREGKSIVRPYCGAVFRCEPDGTNLEEFAYGLRNPQELAFDNYGNLFTCDNNSDSGDRARWVAILPGSDAGWRMYYQYLRDRGPFNREKIWHPQHEGQPAYIVPPVANISDGPSGLVHYPGIGLPERYQDHFFLCDFRGGPGNSGVRSFAVKNKGAGFELVDAHEFLWRILGTDVDFDWQGRMYVSDWVNGWNGQGKGRLYRFEDAQQKPSSEVLKAAQELATGFDKLSVPRLIELLAHSDQRIRREAQFSLVEKNAHNELVTVATSHQSLLPRLHAIWGLGQLGRKDAQTLQPIVKLLDDSNDEVRTQVAKVLADASPLAESKEKLLALLADDNARVQLYAALAIGKFGDASSVDKLLKLLAANNNQDAFLRHGCVMALVDIARKNSADVLLQPQDLPSPARLGVVLALRRLKHESLAQFLADEDPLIVVEAARAIHDEPLDSLLPAVVKLHSSPRLQQNVPAADALARRVINAAFRTEDIDALLAISQRSDLPATIRQDALDSLSEWQNPKPTDRVIGDFRPLPQNRATDVVKRRLNETLPSLLKDAATQQIAARLAGEYELNGGVSLLTALLNDRAQSSALRTAAVTSLAKLKFDGLQKLLSETSEDADSNVRVAARKMLAEKFPEGSLEVLLKGLNATQLSEQQAAVAALIALSDAKAEEALLERLDQLVSGKLPVGLQLDLVEAAQAKSNARFKQLLEKFESKRSQEDRLATWRECIEGGAADRGREVVFGRSEASCLRCHKIGENGGEVGPELSHIGKEKTREYLLEAIVFPNAHIAKGFETTTLVLDTGKVEVGIVKSETDDTVTLMKADGKTVSVAKDAIDDRFPGQSAMPELLKFLSKRELRDLVEYLSSLK